MKRKKEVRAGHIVEQKKKGHGSIIPHIDHAMERLTQRTVKFIRY